MAILELQESGRLQLMYNNWWRGQTSCSNDDAKKDSKASALGVANVGGIFVVLFAGLSLAVIVAVLEFMWNSRKNAVVDRVRTIHKMFMNSWPKCMHHPCFLIVSVSGDV